MSRAIVWRVEHYRDGDDTILYSGGLDERNTEDLIVAENSSEARKIWRSMYPQVNLSIGRVTRVTPLFKDEVARLLDNGGMVGVTQAQLLDILKSINHRLADK